MARCQDREYFLSHYANILTKAGKVIRLHIKDSQRRLLDTVKEFNWVQILKARQIGTTTALAAEFFRMALLRPGFRVLVVAQTKETAEEIFQIYTRFYDNLPRYLKFRVDRKSVREIRFYHGGRIKVTTAGSEAHRGTTWNAIHGTEISEWRDLQGTIAALLQTAAEDAFVVLEGTAKGLNAVYDLWQDQGNGYHKLFFSWLDEPTYVRDTLPDVGPKHFTPEELEYIRAHRLPPERANWFAQTLRTKCANAINTWNQEYPITPEVAFIVSGKRYFTRTYHHISKPGELGVEIFAPPEAYRVYLAGIDTSSGEPGGAHHTVVIVDATDYPEKLSVVATAQLEGPIHEFKETAYDLTAKYGALAVIEIQYNGLDTAQHFERKGYGRVYVRTTFDKKGKKTGIKMGWSTGHRTRALMLSRLNKYAADGTLDLVDPRIKFEMNAFVFGNDGVPRHAQGKKDDLVIGTALSLMGLEQMEPVRHAVQETPDRPPASAREVIEWEARTNRMWSSMEEEEGFGPGLDM